MTGASRHAEGLLLDDGLVRWSDIVRVAWVIDMGMFGTDDRDFLAVEVVSGAHWWIEVTGREENAPASLLVGLPGLEPGCYQLLRHSSGPDGICLSVVLWPPAERGNAMYVERKVGWWPFHRRVLAPALA